MQHQTTSFSGKEEGVPSSGLLSHTFESIAIFSERHGLTPTESDSIAALIKKSYLSETGFSVSNNHFLPHSEIARELIDFLLGKMVTSSKVIGLDHLRLAISSGKRIIIAFNHISHTDALLVRHLLVHAGFTVEILWVAGHKVWKLPEVRAYSRCVPMFTIYSDKYKSEEKRNQNDAEYVRMMRHNAGTLREIATTEGLIGYFPGGRRDDFEDIPNLSGDPESVKLLEMMSAGSKKGLLIIPARHFGSGHILDQSSDKASNDFLRYTNSGPASLVFGKPIEWADIWPVDIRKEEKPAARIKIVRHIMGLIAALEAV